MKDLEEQLSHALRRQEPSPDFAERVLWKIEIEDARPTSSSRWRPLWTRGHVAWLAAAGILGAVLALGIWAYVQRHRGQANKDIIAIVPSPAPSPRISPPRQSQSAPPNNGVVAAPSQPNIGVLVPVSSHHRRHWRGSEREYAEGVQAKKELLAAFYITRQKLLFAETAARQAMTYPWRDDRPAQQDTPER